MGIQKTGKPLGKLTTATHVLFPVILFGVLLVVVPKAADIYEEMGAELPTLTRSLLRFCGVLRAQVLLVPLLLAMILCVDFGMCHLLRRRISPSMAWVWWKITGLLYLLSVLVLALALLLPTLKGLGDITDSIDTEEKHRRPSETRREE